MNSDMTLNNYYKTITLNVTTVLFERLETIEETMKLAKNMEREREGLKKAIKGDDNVK